MARYAGVIVDISHEKLDRVFEYRIPERFEDQIEPGSRVIFPFGKGNRMMTGYVIEVTETPEYDPAKIKELIRPDSEGNSIESDLIGLAAWIRNRYGGTMSQALKTVIPVRKRTAPQQKKLLHLVPEPAEAKSLLAEMERKHHTARARLLQALLEQSPVPYEAVTQKLHITAAVVRSMEEQGLLRVETTRNYRNPFSGMDRAKPAPVLNETQRAIAEDILDRAAAGDDRPSLIHGVTGSGKTEVYMEIIGRVIREGKKAIVLIPEIALTYQTLMRFYGRFGSRVSVLHSRMSAGERSDQFERAQRGEIDVMIGPRSALFTPFSEIGVIIIDEEHESSYKNENTPSYHARETAVRRAQMSGGFVVLGSATPSIESYARARGGQYQLYEMPRRVSDRPMPRVEIVDLRQELRGGNRSILSRALRQGMEERLRKKEQVMLFLNRRGMAGFVSCRSCGEVVKCPHCDVSLSLHKGRRMVCHYCGYEQPEVDKCPSCGSGQIGTFRAGTQKIEEYVAKEFPEARVLRLDADAARAKDSYEKILSAFANQEADILIGTQMIVKGHDFPKVTLVGILAADLSLHVPDFRAGERTFQLLTQAAGRAGRGDRPGEVVIQTYQPDHYSITAAAAQDYQTFFRQEYVFRRLMHYPPAWHMLLVRTESSSEQAADVCMQEIETAVRRLTAHVSERELQLVGPADAFVSKVNDVYRKVFYMKAADENLLIRLKNRLEQAVATDLVSVSFDMDPVNM